VTGEDAFTPAGNLIRRCHKSTSFFVLEVQGFGIQGSEKDEIKLFQEKAP